MEMNLEERAHKDQIVLDFITKRYNFNSKKQKSKSLESISETEEEKVAWIFVHPIYLRIFI